jgi:hypothetical protein
MVRWCNATMRPSPIRAVSTASFSIACTAATTARAGNPPFWAVERPARPHKSALQNRFTLENAKGQRAPNRPPGRARTVVGLLAAHEQHGGRACATAVESWPRAPVYFLTDSPYSLVPYRTDGEGMKTTRLEHRRLVAPSPRSISTATLNWACRRLTMAPWSLARLVAIDAGTSVCRWVAW